MLEWFSVELQYHVKEENAFGRKSVAEESVGKKEETKERKGLKCQLVHHSRRASVVYHLTIPIFFNSPQ